MGTTATHAAPRYRSASRTRAVREATPANQAPERWPAVTSSVVVQGLSVVLPLWIASRAVCLLALTVARTQGAPGTPWLTSYQVFDVGWFVTISQVGYTSTDPNLLGASAFMPLLPALMRWGGDLLGGQPVLAGLIVSNVGALVAALSLYVLARMGLRRGLPLSHRAATLAVAFFLLAPMALPLFIAYSEPLLLALVLPAWIAARREHWWVAGLLTSVGVLARISGMFFAFGIGIMFLLTVWEQTRGRSLPRRLLSPLRPSLLAMLLPAAVYAAWQYELYRATGIPDAAAHAQEVVWGRRVVAPWTGASETWKNWQMWHHPMTPYEVIGLLAIIALAGVMLYVRLWPELGLVAASAVVLLCSSLWGSCLRGLEILFPFWLLVGLALERLERRRYGDAWIKTALILSSLGLFWMEWQMATGTLVI